MYLIVIINEKIAIILTLFSTPWWKPLHTKNIYYKCAIFPNFKYYSSSQTISTF